MTAPTRLMTAEELLELPDDGLLYELVRGELRAMSPGGLRSNRLGVRLQYSFDRFVEPRGLGEVLVGDLGFILERSPDTVRVPDVAFIQRERLDAVGDLPGYFPGAPDLVVEVISPTDRYTDVEDKVAEWLAAGARLVLVVNPRRRLVREFRPDGTERVLRISDTLDGGEVLPGWQMPVRELFEGLAGQ